MALTGLTSLTTKPQQQTAGLQNPTQIGSTITPNSEDKNLFGAMSAADAEEKRRRLQQTQAASSGGGQDFARPSNQGSAAPSSPVTSTGQIVAAAPTGTPAAQPQPQQPVQPQPPPQQPVASPGAGWIQIAGGGWVPPGHPLAGQAGGQPVQGQPQAAMQQFPGQGTISAQLSSQSQTFAQPVPQSAIYTPGSMPQLQAMGQLPQDNLPTYQGYQVGQFQSPDQQQSQNMTNTLMQRVLANPESMSPEVVAQLKETQKEQALSMQDQLMQQIQASNAGRGFSLGGNLDLQRRRIADDTIGNILEGQRGLDIAAAQTNMADRLNALGAAEQSMSGQMGRETAGYQTQLAGQQAQAGQNFQQYGSQADATRFALERALQGEQLKQSWDSMAQQRAAAEEANRQAAAQSALQAHQAGSENQRLAAQLALEESLGRGQLDLNTQLGQQGLGLESQRLGENARQFNQGYNLDMLNFLNNASMGRYNLGVDYAKLQQQMMQYLGGA